MLVQDALGVILVRIPQPHAARVRVAGWEVVPGGSRWQLVTSSGEAVPILPFFLL